MIEQLEAQNGTELAVVTVPLTAPAASPKEFTTELFNYWGIGKKEQDNGVLFLISVGDRRVEIETGYGIEGILPDAKVGRIIDTKIKPRFKQGDFDGGTLAGTQALVVALESYPPYDSYPSSSPAQKLTRNVSIPWELLAGVVAGVVAFGIWLGAAVYMSLRVFIKPSGKSRFSGYNRIFLCANCHKRMKQLDNTKILVLVLSEPQKVAQTIGSVSFEGWQCPNCSQQLAEDDLHLVAYLSDSTRFRRCPTCDEWTGTRTKRILKRATRSSEGKRLIIDECHCCNYRQEKEEIIPRLPPPSSDSWIVSGGSGGGGFGGGSSGGGGSGGSY